MALETTFKNIFKLKNHLSLLNKTRWITKNALAFQISVWLYSTGHGIDIDTTVTLNKCRALSILFLFYLALSPKRKGRWNRFPQLLQVHYCRFLWARKTGVPGEKPSESDRDRQISAHMRVQDSILGPQSWETRMMTIWLLLLLHI